jgi:large subunit ribosomal protein L15
MSIGIHNIQPTAGSTHRRKRVGRGAGSGHGKTSTRGHKGNKARGQVNPNFEGGQTPLHRRLPQIRGFKPVNKKFYALVNLYILEENFEAGETITPELLVEKGILRDIHAGLKVLGTGEVTKSLTVHAQKFSETAAEKLKAAGGTIEVLAARKR